MRRLIDAALKKVAARHRKTVESLKSIPLGKRRNVHDDITVVVIAFKEVTTGECTPEEMRVMAEAKEEEEEEESYYDMYDGLDEELQFFDPEDVDYLSEDDLEDSHDEL